MTVTNMIDLAGSVSQLLLPGLLVFMAIVALKGSKVTGNMIRAFDSMREAFDWQHDTLKDVQSWTLPPEQWSGLIELHRQMTELGSELRDYLIYCHNHAGFIRYDSQGYTPIREEARRFSAAEGLLLVLDRSRNSDPFDCYVLIAVGKERESAVCPYCLETFYAPLNHDPLKKHAEYCPNWPHEQD